MVIVWAPMECVMYFLMPFVCIARCFVRERFRQLKLNFTSVAYACQAHCAFLHLTLALLARSEPLCMTSSGS